MKYIAAIYVYPGADCLHASLDSYLIYLDGIGGLIADMRRMRPAMPQVSDDRPPTYVFIARTFHASLYMIPIFSITLQAVGQAGGGGIEYQPHICSLDNGPRAPLLPLSREFPKFFDVYKGEGGSISFV